MSASISTAAAVAAKSIPVSPSPTAAYKVRLLLIRHGESQMNTNAHLLGGQHNHVSLTAKGASQATLLGKRFHFDRTNFDHVYTSTAVRAKSTAEHALKAAGLTNVPKSETDCLLEQGQGDWEGKHRLEVYTDAVHKEMLDLVRSASRDIISSGYDERLFQTRHLDFSAPGGESLRHVQQRATNFLNTELEKWKKVSVEQKKEVIIGVFGHGGCIRTILNYYCGFHDRWTWLIAQENTAVNEVLFDSKGVSTIRINDTAHLKYSMVAPQLVQESTHVTHL